MKTATKRSMVGRTGDWRVVLTLSAFSLAAVSALASPSHLAAQLPEAGVDRWTRAALAFVRHLESGDFDAAAAQVDASVPEGALSAQQLATVWSQLIGQVGQPTVLTPSRVDQDERFRTVILDARFERMTLAIHVVLTAEERVAGLWFRPPEPPPYTPPAYVDTTAFREIDAHVGDQGAPLPATLTLPRGVARPPVVVLVHGSGPHDRDEVIGPNRPFRDLAWGLATQGVAVLRYDKRTYAQPRSLPERFTVDHEVVDDALAAVAWLRARPEVDSTRVFVLGHSLGGMLAPEIAERDGRLAGVIVMAGSGRPILAIIADQLAHLAALATEAEREQLAEQQARLVEIQRGEASPDEVFLGMQLDYLLDLNRRDPVAAALRTEVPMLILHGGRDYQVSAPDLASWREGLVARPNVTFREYPSLNHLFIHGEGISRPAEYFEAGHVAAEVVADVRAWLAGLGGRE